MGWLLGSITPHVVIEGRPALTKWVWEQCTTKPIILSSQPFRSPILEFADQGVADLFCFFGILCIPEVRELFPEFDFFARLTSIFAVARERFQLGPDEPLNIVAAGSHGSLWTREHAGVGMLADPFEFEDERSRDAPMIDAAEPILRADPTEAAETPEERRSARALELLFEAAENRSFVGHIRTTFDTVGGVRLRWLRECFPGIGALAKTHDRALHEAAHYSREFLGSAYGARLGVALPQIFVRQGDGYKLFSRYDSHDEIESIRHSTNPLRTTHALLRQFGYLRLKSPEDPRFADPPSDGSKVEQRVATFDPESWIEACLTKVLPWQPIHGNPNPLDNPILGRHQWVAACQADISTVLMDKDCGVLDLLDTFRVLTFEAGGPSLDEAVTIIRGMFKMTIAANQAATELEVYQQERKPGRGEGTRARTILDQLTQLLRSVLEGMFLNPLEDTEDIRIVQAHGMLIAQLRNALHSLDMLRGTPVPPALLLGPVVRDLRAIATASRILADQLRRIAPAESEPIDEELRSVVIGDIAATWLTPRIYRI